jgi:2-polyprenyl-3-methyl-5-hydroxy-6-metoxy-1,4-benzoquinol methylase
MTDPTRQLAHSWEANAAAWTAAVRGGTIASRELATDAAILDAIRERKPARVLDVGCGEGWLVRALAAGGIEAKGIDASSALVEAARSAGGGSFQVRSYREISERPEVVGEGYDAIVFNFALFEEELLPLLCALRGRLAPGGALIIQTVHPWSDAGRGAYVDGWRTETFDGFEGFTEPMPWYFRTLASWVALLHDGGYRLEKLAEPAHPDTHEPLSLLMVGEPISASARR